MNLHQNLPTKTLSFLSGLAECGYSNVNVTMGGDKVAAFADSCFTTFKVCPISSNYLYISECVYILVSHALSLGYLCQAEKWTAKKWIIRKNEQEGKNLFKILHSASNKYIICMVLLQKSEICSRSENQSNCCKELKFISNLLLNQAIQKCHCALCENSHAKCLTYCDVSFF